MWPSCSCSSDPCTLDRVRKQGWRQRGVWCGNVFFLELSQPYIPVMILPSARGQAVDICQGLLHFILACLGVFLASNLQQYYYILTWNTSGVLVCMTWSFGFFATSGKFQAAFVRPLSRRGSVATAADALLDPNWRGAVGGVGEDAGEVSFFVDVILKKKPKMCVLRLAKTKGVLWIWLLFWYWLTPAEAVGSLIYTDLEEWCRGLKHFATFITSHIIPWGSWNSN